MANLSSTRIFGDGTVERSLYIKQRLGVGVGSPSAKVQIEGSDSGLAGDWVSEVVRIKADDSGFPGVSFQAQNGDFYGAIRAGGSQNEGLQLISLNNDGSFGNHALTYDNAGNVGIGTTSPSNDLDINTSGTDSGISFGGSAAITGTTGNGWLRLNQNNNFSNGIYTPGPIRADGNGSGQAAEFQDDVNMRNSNIDSVNQINFNSGAFIDEGTADYGSIRVGGGAEGGWAGINIQANDDWVLMAKNNNEQAGFYNDDRSDWIWRSNGDEFEAFHNGSEKFHTYGGGTDFGNEVIRFDGNNDRRIYGASRSGNNTVVIDGNWDQAEIMGRVWGATGTDLHIGNGYSSVDHSSDEIRMGSGYSNVNITPQNNVGIGTNSPGVKLDVEGAADLNGRLNMRGNGIINVSTLNVSSVTSNNGSSHINWKQPVYFDGSSSNSQGYEVRIGGKGLQVDSAVEINDNLRSNGFLYDDAPAYHAVAPTNGTAYSSGSTSGDVRVKFNQGGSSRVMITGNIDVYNYDNGKAISVFFGGYTYPPSPGWINETARVQTNTQDVTVKFCRESDGDYSIRISKSGDWNYPHVIVRNIGRGLASTDLNWNDAVSVDFTTSSPAATDSTFENSIFVERNGNVGIGTNSPNQRLDVEGAADVNGRLNMRGNDINDVRRINGDNGNHRIRFSSNNSYIEFTDQSNNRRQIVTEDTYINQIGAWMGDNNLVDINAGGGLSGGGSTGLTDQMTINHANTSGQGNVSTGGATVIDDINLDGYGHVTNMNTQNRSLDDWTAANNNINLGNNNVENVNRIGDGGNGNYIDFTANNSYVEIQDGGGSRHELVTQDTYINEDNVWLGDHVSNDDAHHPDHRDGVDYIDFDNKEQDDYDVDGRLYWDLSAGLYIKSSNADTNSPEVLWSRANVGAGSNISISYDGEGEPTISASSGNTYTDSDAIDAIENNSNQLNMSAGIDIQSNGDIDSVEKLNVAQIDSNRGNAAIQVTQPMNFTGSGGNSESYEVRIAGKGLLVDDSVRATGDVIAFYSSDRRLKNDPTQIQSPLSEISKLIGVGFDWKEKASREGKGFGIFAQDAKKIDERLVRKQSSGYLGVDYGQLHAFEIEALKQVNENVNQNQSRIQKLEDKVEQLQNKINQIKR